LADDSADQKKAEALSTLTDCTDQCPVMVVIPPGKFVMGAAANGADRSNSEAVRSVTVANGFAIGRTEVTVLQFREFVEATHYSPAAGCYNPSDVIWYRKNPSDHWSHPGFPGYEQTDDDPVVCVSWDDANAYSAWLSAKTHHHYRLLSEAEWEYAAGFGSTDAYYWGNEP